MPKDKQHLTDMYLVRTTWLRRGHIIAIAWSKLLKCFLPTIPPALLHIRTHSIPASPVRGTLPSWAPHLLPEASTPIPLPCSFSDAQALFWETLAEDQRIAARHIPTTLPDMFPHCCRHRGSTQRRPKGNLCSASCSTDLGNNRGWCPLCFQICVQVCQSPPQVCSGWHSAQM